MSRPGVRRIGWTAVIAGAVLIAIGIRFLVVPESAARTFGLPKELRGHELHHIVALRNIWLGAMAIGFATLREWRALALWFGLGAAVCFADSLIVAGSNGKVWAVTFHAACGLLSLVLGALSWLAAAGERRPTGS